MLTSAIIRANTLLAGLTDEQVAAIETMSQTDENKVIGARFGEVYREMDDNIASATGIARNGDEKTYLYLQRAMKEALAKYGDYDTVKADYAALKAKFDKGENGAEDRIKLLQADLDAANNRYADLKTKFDTAEAEHKAALVRSRIDAVLEGTRGALKLRQDLGQEMARLAVDSAIDAVRRMNPSFDESGVLHFRDENNVTVVDPQTGKPATAHQLVSKRLNELGVLEPERKRTGTGGQDQNDVLTIAGAKSRREAIEIIEKGLLSQGLTRGSNEWEAALEKAYSDNKVADLPL